MSLLQYLENEESYLPWKAAMRNLDYMSRRFNSSELLTYEVRRRFTRTLQLEYLQKILILQKFMLYLLENIYDRIGFTGKATDSRLDIYLRMLVTQYACKYGHTECINAAKLEFEHMETSSTHK